jgi:predicted ATPase/class 3 adenylate cyclase/tetratricopeptide (TPR) repeat protein
MQHLTSEPQPALPSGTVTFLFTDIVGSTPLWEQQPAAMRAAVARHHAILHAAAEENRGHVFKIVGDEFQISFEYPDQALGAALAAQRALRDEAWGETGPLKVRMGIHTGHGELREGVLGTRDYAVSHTLNRVARIRSAEHGGQVLVSLATAELLGDYLPQDTTLRDLGEHSLKGLARPEHIFQVVVPDLAADFPPLVSQSRLRHNLPAQPTPFIDREAELAELARLLADPDVRLLTIFGAGGMGKTRLALEAGAAQLDRFEHGVYIVSLAPLRSVDVIVSTVAEALGFAFYTAPGNGREMEPRQQLLDYLRRKRMLLIMDNFEHLLDGVGLVSDILRTAPGVKVLTTSRVRLNVGGEQRFHLAGMAFPDMEPPEDAAEYSAVKLFLQSARRARPGFDLEADDLKYIARICRLVGGMPLGIRLAAAWVAMLTPEEIAAEIGQGLDLLATDLSDVPERQRSVRAVLDHTWNLLTGREREVYMGLSVFRGGFTREAIQEVTRASLRELMALVDKSLLHRAPTGRYEVHEMLQGYAEEKLDQEPAAGEAARDHHCAYYTAALQGWEADLKGPRQRAALAEMDAEIKNARAAWEWAAEQKQVERLDRATEGLCLYYWRRSRFLEGEAACRIAEGTLAASLSLDGAGSPDRRPMGAGNRAPRPQAEGLRVWAKVLAWQGFFNFWLGRRELDGQLLQQSLDLLEAPALAAQDTRGEKAFVLFWTGRIRHQYDYEGARWLFEQSLASYRAQGDRWWTAYVLRNLGTSAHQSGSYGEAKKRYKESIALGQSLGDQMGIADSLFESGVTSRAQGQLEEAEGLYRESFAICQEMDDRTGIADGLGYLGEVHVQRGNFAEGCSSLEESLAICDDLGLPRGLAKAYVTLGEAQAHLGQYEQARAFAQTGLTLYREIDIPWGIGYAHFVLGMGAVAGEAYVEAHQLLGESVSVLREIGHRENLGCALAVLGYAARGLGHLPQARQHLHEALQVVAEIGAFVPLVLALPAVALLLADRGDAQGAERAAELYGLAWRYPFVANSRWFKDVAGRRIAATTVALPPDVIAAAQERGRARDRDTTVAQLLAELGEREVGDYSP